MKIGLTGGIASGKSTVTKLLEELGVEVIDTDQIAHQLMEPKKEVWNKIVDNFGKEILLSSNEIDRKKLGEIIFNDIQAKKKLDQITHPAIIAELRERMREVGPDNLIVAEVPLLIEADMLDLFDRIWLVYVSREVQIERLMARGNFDHQEALTRIESQMPLDEKKQYADRIINNNGTPTELENEVKRVWKEIKEVVNN
ncbi:dephospho-CoA kinase [Halobacteroides halobius DSM 5150]|uniref:Dephospho-CoA kinase n=1 Tax=Halobacteroides halobius (strain ATCC 35273 / DSM 5150 / MD-1) TaxID=748449 RepID=L0K587_HALHC|nr:dephospho-CoA kinase [Halobacteroides halobius]AGB40427.1 dephospho-CoA kinase [Halobacteroides halobius DSM 5150]